MSLTNQPKQLVETALDTISEVLSTDCCWVQMVRLGSDKLPLVSSRGFTKAMQHAMSSMDTDHEFGNEIVGLGNKIVINDLSRDGKYGIPVFERSGFNSLIAVPIMTYKVHGILGLAYRSKKKFSSDFAELAGVVANLMGMSLSKAILDKAAGNKENPETRPALRNTGSEPATPGESPMEERAEPVKRAEAPAVSTGVTPKGIDEFQDHLRHMNRFKNSHRPR